jgi:5-methyltetrahydrofolate--homocysteine methyltransferase
MKGIDQHLPEDLAEALKTYSSPVEIVEKPLMKGMNIVGELFGEGKMFLPQVVKTARTMKKAVDILQPYIEQAGMDNLAPVQKQKFLIATVKGDVHDIGKNIVSVILSCNNYEVIDLGVMVPAEEIVREAKERNADIVGLSGLITPSLDEMTNVATEMEKAGLTLPLFIGGAATSKLHTALKIAPAYSGTVVYSKDASQNVAFTSAILNPDSKAQFIDETLQQYEALRQQETAKTELVDMQTAKQKRLELF